MLQLQLFDQQYSPKSGPLLHGHALTHTDALSLVYRTFPNIFLTFFTFGNFGILWCLKFRWLFLRASIRLLYLEHKHGREVVMHFQTDFLFN